MLRIKRIYDKPEPSDGYRVLVDRLWPRGLSKERAALDEWLKEIAPSPTLRTWFGHEPARFAEFKARYKAELSANPAVEQISHLLHQHQTVTLLYGARDPKHNHTIVLQEYVSKLAKE